MDKCFCHLNGYEVKDAKARNTITQMEYYITPEMFGAVGDGVTDDWESCQRAIDYVGQNGGVLLFNGSKTYVISDCLIVKDSNIIIDGSNCTLTRIGNGGYSGDVLRVCGYINGREYYGLYDGDYSKRTIYDGESLVSRNITIKNFKVECETEIDAINGITITNGLNVVFENCEVHNVPQVSFASVMINDNNIDVSFIRCKSVNANGHGFRSTSYNTTDGTKIITRLIECVEEGSKGNLVSDSTKTTNQVPCGFFVRTTGTETINKHTVYIENCVFENGIDSNALCDLFIKNSVFKFFQKDGNIDNGKSYHAYLENDTITGSVNNEYNYSVYALNGGNIFIKNCKLFNKKVLFYTPEKLNIENCDIVPCIGVKGSLPEQKIEFKSCTLSLNSNETLAVSNGEICFDECEILFNEGANYFSTTENTFIRFLNNRIKRYVGSSYGTFRSLKKGLFAFNTLVILIDGYYGNIQQPTETISVHNNKIIQGDIEFIDYGGFSNGVPTTGYRNKGQFVYELNPVINGVMGYVCIESGNSGTWKGFGNISE